jgi:glycine dehydrogenase subunit 2
VLSANYLRVMLRDTYETPYDRTCMHEFVVSGRAIKSECGVRTLDVAKRLLDYGCHPPTVYFPLIVEEAMMLEPTETEPLSSLDRLVDALVAIAREAHETPDLVKGAPYTTPVRRIDEARAAREPRLRWTAPSGE